MTGHSLSMPVKHCCYGDCNSDSRYVGRREDMENIFFIPFPKPKTQREKCERWIRLCGRKFFTVENVRKETYICSKHFVGDKGPTKENPDPLPALATNFERNLLLSKRKRKSPLKRYTQPNLSKRKKLMFDPTEDLYNSDSAESENNLPVYSVDTDHCYSQTNNTMVDGEQPMSSSGEFPEQPLEIMDDDQLAQEAVDSEVFDTTLGLYYILPFLLHVLVVVKVQIPH